MKIFYFTGSGNSLYTAKSIGGELYSIPQVLKNREIEYSSDKIGIVFPCYVGSVPTLVKEFIKKVKLNSDYIFAIITYGGKSIGAGNHFLSFAKKAGIKISYLNTLLMVDNSIKFYDMDKEISKEESKNIEENLRTIKSDIDSNRNYIDKNSFIFSMLSRLGHKLYLKEIGDVDKKFSVESHCNGCGICKKVCPMDNIVINNKPEFKHNCIRCYACTHNCPKNAIRMKGEKSRARFVNRGVSLKEIIDSNNQEL